MDSAGQAFNQRKGGFRHNHNSDDSDSDDSSNKVSRGRGKPQGSYKKGPSRRNRGPRPNSNSNTTRNPPSKQSSSEEEEDSDDAQSSTPPKTFSPHTQRGGGRGGRGGREERGGRREKTRGARPSPSAERWERRDKIDDFDMDSDEEKRRGSVADEEDWPTMAFTITGVSLTMKVIKQAIRERVEKCPSLKGLKYGEIWFYNDAVIIEIKTPKQGFASVLATIDFIEIARQKRFLFEMDKKDYPKTQTDSSSTHNSELSPKQKKNFTREIHLESHEYHFLRSSEEILSIFEKQGVEAHSFIKRDDQRDGFARIEHKEYEKLSRVEEKLRKFLDKQTKRDAKFTFPRSESKLVNFFKYFMANIQKTCKKRSVVLSFFSPDIKSQAPNITYRLTLFGDKMMVLQTLKQIEDYRKSLVLKTKKLPADLLRSLYKDENLKSTDSSADIDLKSNTIMLWGTREGVQSVEDYIEDKMGTSLIIENLQLEPGQAQYIQQFHSSEYNRVVNQPNLKVSLNKNETRYQIRGVPSNVEPVHKLLKKLIGGIQVYKQTRTFSTGLLNFLKIYLEEKLLDHSTNCLITINEPDSEKPPIKKKQKKKKKKDSDDEDSDDEDEDEETEDSISVVSRESDMTSQGSTMGKKGERGENKFFSKVDIYVIFAKNPSFETKLSKFFSSFDEKSLSITFPPNSTSALKKLDPSVIKMELKVHIFVNTYSKIVFVKGFNPESCKEAEKRIKDQVNGNLSTAQMLKFKDLEHFHYFRNRDLASDLEARYGVKCIVIQQKNSVKICGSPQSVQVAHNVASEEISRLKSEKQAFEAKYQVKRYHLDQLKNELTDRYNLTIRIINTPLSMILTGDSGLDWASINAEIDKLRREAYIWENPKAADRIKKLIISKQLDPSGFCKDWNLQSIFTDTTKGQVSILARDPEDIKNAIQHLETLIENTSVSYEVITFGESPWLYNFLLKKDLPFREQAFRIFKNNGVNNNPNQFQQSIKISGPKLNVQSTKTQLAALITSMEGQLQKSTVKIDLLLAKQFKAAGWKKANAFFDQSNAYLNFPEDAKNRVVVDLKNPNGYVIEIVQGNLLKEPVECIVNPANEKLEHKGGLAKEISERAGPNFQTDCREILKRFPNLHVPTGEAVQTTSGDLNLPIKAVIHAVGPDCRIDKLNQQRDALLRSAVRRSLEIASESSFKSISMPPISAGIFGYPPEECTKAMIRTVFDFLEGNHRTSLKHVRLCVLDDKIAQLFEADLKEICDENANKNEFEIRELAHIQRSRKIQVHYQWTWRENNGVFMKFDPDQNYQIEVAYLKQGKKGKITVTGDFLKLKNNYTYEINFDNMTEINTHFRANYRPIKRERITTINPVVWEIITSQGWMPFDDSTNSNLETAFKQQTVFQYVQITWMQKQASVFFNPTPYLIQDGRKFDVRRRQIDPDSDVLEKLAHHEKAQSEIHAYSNKASVNSKEKFRKVPVEIIGLSDTLVAAQAQFEREIDNLLVTKNISLPSGLFDTLPPQFKSILSNNGVELIQDSLKSDPPFITIRGPEESVSRSTSEILEESLNASAKGLKSFKIPSTWDQQTDDCVLMNVPADSQEFKDVASQFNKSLANGIVKKVERIQNKPLWMKFCANRDLLAAKNERKDPNQMRLFHGTRLTKPEEIYHAENGLDMRFSNEGLWGNAIYLASDSSYSDEGYAHQIGNDFQMFLVDALIGDAIELLPDKTIRKPPRKGVVKGVGTDYDAITGMARGTRVYMIYELGRVYPQYLITYQKPKSFFRIF